MTNTTNHIDWVDSVTPETIHSATLVAEAIMAQVWAHDAIEINFDDPALKAEVVDSIATAAEYIYAALFALFQAPNSDGFGRTEAHRVTSEAAERTGSLGFVSVRAATFFGNDGAGYQVEIVTRFAKPARHPFAKPGTGRFPLPGKGEALVKIERFEAGYLD